MLNRIVLIGRLTRDPELKYTPQGMSIATMGIAVDRFTKDENGQKEVDFFDLVAFSKKADFASQYLGKGRLISVEGRLQSRSWVAQDGTKRKTFEIIVDNIDGLDRKGDTEGQSGGMQSNNGTSMDAPPAPLARPAAAPAAASSGGRKPAPPPVDDDLDESDPFADE